MCEDACPLAAVMQDGRPRSADVFLLHKLGYRVPVHVYGAPVYDRRGNILGAFETFADRTQHLAAIERMQVLEQAAYLDALTGLPNRRYLEQALETSLGQMQRTAPAFGVILGDVDHFKRFNDTYGHPTGDRVLQVVAQTLLRACRTYDVAGRWGGEEFLVVAGHGTVEGVRTAAERLRALVAQAEVTDGGRRLAVKMSFGATLAARRRRRAVRGGPRRCAALPEQVHRSQPRELRGLRRRGAGPQGTTLPQTRPSTPHAAPT